jgi:hypothetical protein
VLNERIALYVKFNFLGAIDPQDLSPLDLATQSSSQGAITIGARQKVAFAVTGSSTVTWQS